ncbi:hypothetical protein HUJ04_008434 [Dendroctonus ponderosae]|nr:hypothetical protein HUJ04_008434 [Dendroctonus ponderosae]KAH1002339.1 hypothetical protein HUJ04_008434 [Dendroctonus ponderosae]
MSQYKEPPPPYSAEYPAVAYFFSLENIVTLVRNVLLAVHQYGPPPPGAYPPPTAQQFYPAAPPAGNYYGPPPPQAPFPPQGYGATSTTIVVENPEVIVIGACPSCRVGVLEDDFTCLGVFCAIFFFPLGILCCLAMREKRCSNCHATFG